MGVSQLEGTFSWQIKLSDLPEPVREHRFHVERRWRFDFAWPDLMIAVECEGHGGKKSRHLTYLGYTNDCEKYNEAAIMGWKVLRFTGPMIKSGEALAALERAVADHE